MKKIKFLNGFILFLLTIHVIFFIGNIYISSFTEFGADINKIDENLIFGSYTRYIQSTFSLILFFGLIFIHLGLRTLIEKGYFNTESASDFRKGGLFFLISGILSLVMETYLFLVTKVIAHLGFMAQEFLILLMGISLYILADFIQHGSLMRQDNELTI